MPFLCGRSVRPAGPDATNPYQTWVGWDGAAQAAGKCNSHCKTADSTGSATACPCLMYLTPLQIDQLNAASDMKTETVAVSSTAEGGKLSFELPAYGSVNIRFGL